MYINEKYLKFFLVSKSIAIEAVEHFKLSETDTGIIMTLFSIAIISQIAFFYAYYQKVEQLNKVLKTYKAINLPEVNLKMVQKWSFRVRIKHLLEIIFVWSLCFLMAYVQNNIKWHLLQSEFDLPNYGKWLFCLLYWWTFVTLLASPLMFGTDLFIEGFLQGPMHLFDFWKSETQLARR